jgi:hypothetical protein
VKGEGVKSGERGAGKARRKDDEEPVKAGVREIGSGPNARRKAQDGRWKEKSECRGALS